MSKRTVPDAPVTTEPNRGRRLFYVGGTLLVGWGVLGLLTDPRSNPVAWARFAAVVIVANDGVLAPLAILVGVLLVRVLPPARRHPVQIGLLISAAVTLVALPSVLGYGRSADNTSALPQDYVRGLLIVLSSVWVAIGFVTLGARLIRRRRSNARHDAGPVPR